MYIVKENQGIASAVMNLSSYMTQGISLLSAEHKTKLTCSMLKILEACVTFFVCVINDFLTYCDPYDPFAL